MIVKIEKKDDDNECIGYYYYEADEIEYWVTEMKKAKEYNFDGCDWIIKEDHENRDTLVTTILFLYKTNDSNRNEIRKIITTRCCYILNNNGKTIDKLVA